MAQFIALVRRTTYSFRSLRRSGNFQEPDQSRARKRGRSGTIIRALLNRPNCRKLPLSLIRQTQGSREARERSHFRRSRARQRVKAFINNNYREDRTKTIRTSGERGKGIRQRKSRMSTIQLLYTDATLPLIYALYQIKLRATLAYKLFL
jgi:hypothetical protein